MNEGWKCPVCGRGVAPSQKTCDHEGWGGLTYVPPLTIPATEAPIDRPRYPSTGDPLPPLPNTWCGGTIQATDGFGNPVLFSIVPAADGAAPSVTGQIVFIAADRGATLQ